MAIINSTVMGKTRGKIGNVVTTVLKGQVIAKSRNYAPANPKTVLQTNSRGKMSNAVLAWQFLAIFLVSIDPLRKSTESTYNAFVRFTKNEFSAIVAGSRSLAAATLAGVNFGFGNIVSSVALNVSGDNLNVAFSTGGSTKPSDLHVRSISFAAVSGSNGIIDRLVTDLEWSDGSLELLDGALYGEKFGCYFYSKMENKCSGVLFGEI